MAQNPPSPAEIDIDLQSLVSDVVALAMKGGASDAEAVAREGDEFSVNVRMGEVETVTESGSRALGLRVFHGRRSASTSTSDLTAAGIRKLVDGAIALARITEEDPFAGLPDAEEYDAGPSSTVGLASPVPKREGSGAPKRSDSGLVSPVPKCEGPGALAPVPDVDAYDLHLYFDDVYSLPAAERVEWARRCEAAALTADPRINNSDGGSFNASTGRRAMANSRGFAGGYRSSYAGVSAAPLATDADGKMQRAGWWSSSRSFALLDSPENVGAEAARRTLRKLGARRVPTQRVPIVFSPEAARTLVGTIFEAVSGDSIWRSASFLAGKLGETIAVPELTLIDDNLMVLANGAGGFGTSPFDAEGLPSRRTVVIENGVLKNYMLNTYSARKLGMKSTHNAARGLAGAPGIGCGNLYVQPGSLSEEEMLGELKAGLYVTSLMGTGVNVVTGDYSRGAAGLWIENGELTHAVEEITIAGNLGEMLKNITAIGSDLEFHTSIASPTLRIDGMTVGGS